MERPKASLIAQAKRPGIGLRSSLFADRSRAFRPGLSKRFASRHRSFCLELAIAGAIALSSTAFAIDPNRALTQCNHRIWQVQQGLPQASVYSVRQSHDGFLWLGTQTGLVRFDGARFASITRIGDVSLDRVWVRSLTEDRGHALWVATDGNGLFRVANGSATHFAKGDGLPSDGIQCVAADAHGVIWAGTDRGLARLMDGKWTVLGTPQGLDCQDIRAIALGSDGKLWVAGRDATQIYLYDGVSFIRHPLTAALPFTSIQAMLPGPSGKIVIGTSQGLFILNNGSESRLTAKEGLANDWVYCLSNGADGSLWVGTKDGFSRVREDGIESFRARDGLSQSAVFSITEDREGSLWVGTKHGLNQFLDRRAVPFTESEGLISNNTGAILEDHTGTLWAGTLDAGLCKFDGRRFVNPPSAPGDSSGCSNVVSLAEDSNHDLWAGTDHGLCRVSEARAIQTLTATDGLANTAISCLFAGDDGLLWVGTTTGISTVQNHKIFHLPELDSIQHSSILAIGRSRGDIVIATPEGLFRHSQATLIPLSASTGSPQDVSWQRSVDSIYEDHDGLLWIGTRGSGLRLIDGNREAGFSIRDGLFDDDIYGVAVDDQDRVWMACSQGVFWVKRADLLHYLPGQLQPVVSTPFSPTDNLRTVECQAGVQPVIFPAKDGKLWFSTAHGLLVFNTAHLQRSIAVPPPMVEDVIVNGEREESSAIAELSPGKKNLEFHYTGLSFTSPTFMKFKYQLEGFDKDWIDAGTRREAFYTNLAPGKYRFKVLAANNESGFGELPATVDFTLLPRFYQQWWFFPAVAIVALASAAAVYRQRMHRIRLHIAAILAERSRIARELHDTLLQGFSGVTMEMQALLMRLRSDNERTVLEGIIQDAAACMREARRSVAGLRSARGEEGLAAAVSQSAVQLTEATKLKLKLKLSAKLPPLSPETEYNILRIAHEAVANVVKHANASWVEVSLAVSSGVVQLLVRDDGRGFEPGLPPPGQHYGLVGIRERAAQINASVQVESRPGHGTTMILRLPIKQRQSSPADEQDEPARVSVKS